MPALTAKPAGIQRALLLGLGMTGLIEPGQQFLHCGNEGGSAWWQLIGVGHSSVVQQG